MFTKVRSKGSRSRHCLRHFRLTEVTFGFSDGHFALSVCNKRTDKTRPEIFDCYSSILYSSAALTVRVHVVLFLPAIRFGNNVSQSIFLSRGTVKGERRQGRQRKRWEDNIRESTGLEFVKFQRAVENSDLWCPNDPRG